MDFLESKGIEYLMVIVYLLVLIPFWMIFRRLSPPPRATAPAERAARPASRAGWFDLRDGRSYHRGHTWAAATGDRTFRVGVDDFVRQLVGRPDALRLPEPGRRLEEGQVACGVCAGSREIPLLSPVSGRVRAVNREALSEPWRVSDDPYDGGWLYEVEVPSAAAVRRNLLPVSLARQWMRETTERLTSGWPGELGTVMQDGGLPVFGFVREMSADHTDELIRTLLLLDGEHGGAATAARETPGGSTPS